MKPIPIYSLPNGYDSTCFATGQHIKYLVAVLNSKMGNYLLKDSPKTGTGDLLISVQAVDPIKIPIPIEEESIMDSWIDNLIIENSIINDGKINRKVYELYGLSADEVAFIENL